MRRVWSRRNFLLALSALAAWNLRVNVIWKFFPSFLFFFFLLLLSEERLSITRFFFFLSRNGFLFFFWKRSSSRVGLNKIVSELYKCINWIGSIDYYSNVIKGYYYIRLVDRIGIYTYHFSRAFVALSRRNFPQVQFRLTYFSTNFFKYRAINTIAFMETRYKRVIISSSSFSSSFLLSNQLLQVETARIHLSFYLLKFHLSITPFNIQHLFQDWIIV